MNLCRQIIFICNLMCQIAMRLKLGHTIMKIRAHYEHISKIPSRGWRAWKNWFLIIATFLDRAIFQSIRSEKMGQKRTGAKMSKVSKITLFMLVDLTNEFLKYVLYLQTFLPGLLPHCNWTYMTSEKYYLISSISFDMSYLKITFQTQFSGTLNTLFHKQHRIQLF